VSDRIFGALALILAIAYGLHARTFKSGLQVAMDPLGPSTFPYLLAVVLAITGVYLIIRPDPSPHWPDRRHLLEMAGVIVVLCLYALALEEIGFVLATFAAVAFIGWRLGARPLPALVNGVAVAVVLFGLFDQVLGLPLPSGLLGFF
jgi:putative tricarboxylic transport membrane protein